MNHEKTILTQIMQYLSQRQALTGNIAYTVPLSTYLYAADSNNHTSTTEITMHNPETSVTDIYQHEQVILPSPATTDIQAMEHTRQLSPEQNVSFPSLFGSDAAIKPQIEKKTPSPDGTSAWQSSHNLAVLYEHIHTCQNCKLGATRTKFVFGTGNPNAGLMVIGEAPGADEDTQGEPFVGRGGQLLTKILEAIDFKREDVYIANIIKCRPPENRRPEADEVTECEPYLYKQIELVQPKFILALGLTAVNTLLKSKHTMGAIRGKILEFRGVPMMTTYHPAALLRNPEWKRAAWEDVQLLRKLYDEIC